MLAHIIPDVNEQTYLVYFNPCTYCMSSSKVIELLRNKGLVYGRVENGSSKNFYARESFKKSSVAKSQEEGIGDTTVQGHKIQV